MAQLPPPTAFFKQFAPVRISCISFPFLHSSSHASFQVISHVWTHASQQFACFISHFFQADRSSSHATFPISWSLLRSSSHQFAPDSLKICSLFLVLEISGVRISSFSSQRSSHGVRSSSQRSSQQFAAEFTARTSGVRSGVRTSSHGLEMGIGARTRRAIQRR